MKLKWFFILVFISATAHAQVFEAGVFVGGSNGISDVGSNLYVNPNSEAYGIIFKWNKSLRYAWRISASQTQLIMDDSKSSIVSRENRAYRFDGQLRDITAGLEVNFNSFELHRFNSSWTPYIATGLSYYQYQDSYFNTVSQQFKSLGTKDKFALPIIIGLKIKATKFIVLAIESGIRYSFNDNLDGSHPIDLGLTPYVFGNTSSKDWYVFSGMTITYTFGKKPCTQCYN